MAACAAANLPFMVEKPLAVTLEGIEETLGQVRAKNLVARVGYIRRIANEVLALRDQIKAGKIGQLRLVYMNGSQEFPKYRPDYRTTYYANPEMGGGAILDAASHLFDLLIWIAGPPEEVSCMYDTMVLQGTRTEDTCLIHIRFKSGVMAAITINQFQKPNTSRLEFIGTKANLLLEHTTLSLFDNDAPQPAEAHDHMDALDPMAAHQARFAMQASAMLDAIEKKPCHLATLDEAHLNLRLALAAKKSWDTRKIVKLEP
jgi:predicted dehydrogenase